MAMAIKVTLVATFRMMFTPLENGSLKGDFGLS
jgi:hypothetical protein